MRNVEGKLKDGFPFGSWTAVSGQANGNLYAGRRARVAGDCVEVSAPEFIDGRRDEVNCGRAEKGETPLPPIGRAECQSA
eukprot:7874345-Pyramimonas_sp.AAC.1